LTEFMPSLQIANITALHKVFHIPRGDPALPLTDDELLTKYRECGRSQLRPDDIERSVGLVLGLETVADIGTLMAILGSPLREA
jgi:hypothetical protein